LDNDADVSSLSPARRSPGRPLILAHRGGRALGPENTIPAFDLGLAAGADGLELDVHVAADGEAVVVHDATLDRTTDATGPVAARTARELAAVNAALRCGVELERPWTGQRAGIPTLREVLRRYPSVPVVIEMKAASRGAAAAVVRAVRDCGAEARVCIGSFSHEAVRAVRVLAPEIATSASQPETRWALYGSWVGLPPWRPRYRAFQVPERAGGHVVVSPRFLRAVHRAGAALQVWTVNDPQDMRRLLTWGVDGLITDCPDVGVRVRDAWLCEQGIGAGGPGA
jgi:glycerophosphoryl diester phosphodiesterase